MICALTSNRRKVLLRKHKYSTSIFLTFCLRNPLSYNYQSMTSISLANWVIHKLFIRHRLMLSFAELGSLIAIVFMLRRRQPFIHYNQTVYNHILHSVMCLVTICRLSYSCVFEIWISPNLTSGTWHLRCLEKNFVNFYYFILMLFHCKVLS